MSSDPSALNPNALGGWGPTDIQGQLHKAVVDISSAQILALNTTPVELVPAVPGMVIEPVLYRVQFFQGTQNYGNGGAVSVKWGTNVSNDSLLNGLLTLGVNTYQSVRAASFSFIPSAGYPGKALNLGTGPQFTGGDGTLRIVTFYRLISVQ